MRKYVFLLIVLVISSVLLTNCSPPASPVTQVSQTVAINSTASKDAGQTTLSFTGKVSTPQVWTEAAVRSMQTIQVESTNKQGNKSSYTGVPLEKLMALAGVQNDASTLVFIAGDGTQAEASLADMKACDQCIVSFRNNGGFSMVLPGFPADLQIKGVVEIQAE